jgi:hypothetical protein
LFSASVSARRRKKKRKVGGYLASLVQLPWPSANAQVDLKKVKEKQGNGEKHISAE